VGRDQVDVDPAETDANMQGGSAHRLDGVILAVALPRKSGAVHELVDQTQAVGLRIMPGWQESAPCAVVTGLP
jgi:hypothetical protein